MDDQPRGEGRRRLPNRRPGITMDLDVNGVQVTFTVNVNPQTGRVAEVFLAGPKPGSPLAVLLEDAAVIISVALQHGIRPAALAKSISTRPAVHLDPSDLIEPDTTVPTLPASVLGTVLRWIANVDEGRINLA